VSSANLDFGASSDAEVRRERVVGAINIIDVSLQTPTAKGFVLRSTV
jgi:hypothetical protein